LPIAIAGKIWYGVRLEGGGKMQSKKKIVDEALDSWYIRL
jgi:hypothetical protein